MASHTSSHCLDSFWAPKGGEPAYICLPPKDHKRISGCRGFHSDQLRNLSIRLIMCGRSSSFIAVNFSPSPLGSTRRTTASARICPFQLRNSRWTSAPIALGLRVSMNRPSKLKSRTRAVSSHPPQLQITQTSSGIVIRELSRREGGTVCFSMRHLRVKTFGDGPRGTCEIEQGNYQHFVQLPPPV